MNPKPQSLTPFTSCNFGPLLGLMALLSGCLHAAPPSDNGITQQTGYSVDQVYRLKRPFFVERFPKIIGKPHLALVKVGRVQNGPDTVEQYLNGDKRKWPQIAGLLDPGTRIKIAKIHHERDFELGHIFYIDAQVLDGPMRGAVVDIRMISKRTPRGTPPIWVPEFDPENMSKYDTPATEAQKKPQ